MTGPRAVERVADYPRPPALEPVGEVVRIEFGGVEIARTAAAWRVLETTHPPTYYLPIAAFRPGALAASRRRSFCEWKGVASYWDVVSGTATAPEAAWGYPAPTGGFAPIRDHVAVYAGRMDGCFVGDERVAPQPGGFYGGWVTANLVGPFKGGPGTQGW